MLFPASRLLSLLPLAFGTAAAAIVLLPALSEGTSPYAAIASIEFLLPLLGIGVLLAQLPGRLVFTGLACILFGGLFGLWFRETLYGLLAPLPGAAPHLFLAGPIACALVGLVLVLPPRQRGWLCLPVFLVSGAALAIATHLGDPVLFADHYRLTAPLLQALLVASVAWPTSLCRSPGFTIATRIVGSWMLAVALLYGSAYLAGREIDLTPPDFPAIPQASSAQEVSP